MTATPSIRPLTRADSEPALALMRQALGSSLLPRTLEFWNWKHFLNPFGHSPGLVAEANGNMVGLRVFLRWRWHSGNEAYEALRAVDTATHPDWRRRGIFRELTSQLVEIARDDKVSIIFNTPNAASRAGYLKMGWSSVGRVPVYFRPCRLMPIVRRILRPKNPSSTTVPGPSSLPPIERLLEQEHLPTLLEIAW